jgi:hypothetical protein
MIKIVEIWLVSQGHLNFLIHLNLAIPSTKCLGKLAKGTMKVAIHKVVTPS